VRRSYSQLDVFQACPEQYRWKYIERLPEQPSVWTVGGTAFHTMAERILRGQVDYVDLFTSWMDAWYLAQEEAERGYERKAGEPAPPIGKWRAADRGREKAAWWQEHGFAMVQRFRTWWNTKGSGLTVLEHDGQLGLELEIVVDLGGVEVLAIPDLLVVDEHGQINVVDYKTGRPPKTPKQLSVYRAAVEEGLGLPVTWGLHYMARHGELIPWDLGRYDSPEEIGRQFAEFDALANAGKFDPKPGDACKFCPYKERCSAYKENA
jgi:RecB family exonuclease